MEGVELCLRFSYITNSLQFCGPNGAHIKFLKYLENKEDKGNIENLLKKFEGILPYISVIAERNNKQIFDQQVIEAYWLGNELLDNLTDSDNKKIIENLIQRGLLRSIGEKLISNLPLGLSPCHLFNVMYVGVGMLTRSVETNLTNMDNCRISWGKVIEVLDDKLIVLTNKLEKENGKYILKNDEIKTVVYLKEMFFDIQKGDNIAIHWGLACMKLNEKQLENLKKYTGKNFIILNNGQ